MNSSKSCPLLLSAAVVAMGAGAGRVTVSRESSYCQGPSCAWYDAARECCALVSIARRAV